MFHSLTPLTDSGGRGDAAAAGGEEGDEGGRRDDGAGPGRPPPAGRRREAPGRRLRGEWGGVRIVHISESGFSAVKTGFRNTTMERSTL